MGLWVGNEAATASLCSWCYLKCGTSIYGGVSAATVGMGTPVPSTGSLQGIKVQGIEMTLTLVVQCRQASSILFCMPLVHVLRLLSLLLFCDAPAASCTAADLRRYKRHNDSSSALGLPSQHYAVFKCCNAVSSKRCNVLRGRFVCCLAMLASSEHGAVAAPGIGCLSA
jgi:hypothetical protein